MMRYVLITPARNEAAFIQKTLDAVVVQTCLPEQWVVVDDASTDATPAMPAALSAVRRVIDLDFT